MTRPSGARRPRGQPRFVALALGVLAACAPEPPSGSSPPAESSPSDSFSGTNVPWNVPLLDAAAPGVLVERTQAEAAIGARLLGVAWWQDAWWLAMTWPQGADTPDVNAVGLVSPDLGTVGHRWPFPAEGEPLSFVALPDGAPIVAHPEGESVVAWPADKARPTVLSPAPWHVDWGRVVAWAPSAAALGWGMLWEVADRGRQRGDPRGPWWVGRELADPDFLPYEVEAKGRSAPALRRGPGGRLAAMWTDTTGDAHVWRSDTEAGFGLDGRPFTHFFLTDGQLVVVTDGPDAPLLVRTDTTSWRLPLRRVGDTAVDLHCGGRDFLVLGGLRLLHPYVFVLTAPDWRVFAAEPLPQARLSSLAAACGPEGLAVSWQAGAAGGVIESRVWTWE